MTKNSERAIDAKLTRRAFVGAAAATAAVGLAGCAPAATDEAPAKDEDLPVTGEDPYANAEIFYSTCPPECQHHNLKGYVVDGKLVKVESSELNDCAACARGIARGFMCNDPNRLTVPLLRDGDKGSGKFKEIAWDEAFDLIQQKLDEAIADKKDNTQELFRAAVSTVDKVAAKGAIHKKAANRKKAQLARAMQNA